MFTIRKQKWLLFEENKKNIIRWLPLTEFLIPRTMSAKSSKSEYIQNFMGKHHISFIHWYSWSLKLTSSTAL